MVIKSKELDKLNRDLSEIGRDLFKVATEVPVEITRRLAIGANDIRNTIIKSMQNTPKTGRHYKRGKSGKFHIASSPGEAPAIDFGELLRSIFFDVRPLEVEVGSFGGAPYAEFLEEGTSKMEARPFLGPAVEEHEKDIVNDVGRGVFELTGKPFEKI